MASNICLSYLINHVFLPPKLPQKDDSDFESDVALIEALKNALSLFQDHFPTREQGKWAACARMLSRMLEMRDARGEIIPEKVVSSLAKMNNGDFISLHVRGQNAGLIIRKLPAEVSFESFELSPNVGAVMGTKGRLVRCFPGPAIAIEHGKLADASFREPLAQLLAQLDVSTPLEAWPKTTKAGTESIEIRDTVHPKFVTEMLTGLLRGIGQPREVARIHKRTRDDVLWKNALKPWRRSPLWLLLRVALQTSLNEEMGGHRRYKSFMAFFLAHLLQRAVSSSLPSDTLFIMAAKISRRTLKIAAVDHPFWLQYVHQAVEAAHVELRKRWWSIEQNQDILGVQSNLSQLSFLADTCLSLSSLQPYLADLSTRENATLDINTFQPACHSRLQLYQPILPQLADFLRGSNDDFTTRLTLMDVESWVETNLDQWLARNLDSPTSCRNLARLIEDYTTVASSSYAGFPEDISLMLLTTMHLWVALDICAIEQHPLLKDYQPGFPLSLLDPLLLPKRAHMERLACIERHIQQRTSQATFKSALIFQDTNAANSFNIRYFQQSSDHQELRRNIENAASIARTKKLEELRRQTAKYRSLMQSYNSRCCTQVEIWDSYRERYYTQHSSSCEKCRLKAEADRLEIKVHEWPLPYIELEAKSAVFELDVPISISKWRDITYTLLVDVFAPPKPNKFANRQILYHIQNFTDLSRYFKNSAGRLQHASGAKPFVVSHYSKKRLDESPTETNICVNNGLHYSIYDSRSGQWPKELLNRCDVLRICTFQLPSGPYEILQDALDRTTHTSNEVLSRQATCPGVLNQHEFYAFACLRSGNRLQWRNIASELRSRSLNFSHEETYLLIAQAVWQAGPSATTFYRDSHTDLDEVEFGLTLLSELQSALDTVEGNWQGAVAVRCFIIIAARLLSLSPHHSVHGACYLFLKRARHVTLGWARDVGELRHKERDEGGLKVLNLRTLEMALTCHGTFDVDRMHHLALLNSADDVAVITECSIIIHDRCPAITENLPRHVKILLKRYERLSCFVESKLRELIVRDQAGMNGTMQRVWSGFRPGGPWIALPEPNKRWLVTNTSDSAGYSSMTVHYNILNGELLVNGSPLTRLPQAYELHGTYRRLLGEKALDVVPSTMEGMIFETRDSICDQQIHFRMYGSELIIRARNEELICEAIPIHTMEGDFPVLFVQNYAHWLDINTGEIEWRPLSNAWKPSMDSWRTRTIGHNVFLSRGLRTMIDIRSHTAVAISHLLSSIEEATHIHIFLNRETEVVEIHLPRLKLDFVIRDASTSLESKQFRGMVVDERQSFGAFTGLVNKLVLCETEGLSRCVIVLYGSVSFKAQEHHVRVCINTGSAVHLKYHMYQIDSQLGRLVDNGSLQSRLYRLYLHAVTSHCLVDQLTRRTGTEEALYGLAGAASHSFVELGDVDLELLKKLAHLTPRRDFYPKHLQVMQQVEWSSLSSLSQHGAFRTQVASILDQAKMLQVCQEALRLLPDNLGDRGIEMLLERSSIRESSFQVHHFGAEAFTTDHDILYEARDQIIDSTREIRAYRTAKLVAEWPKNLTICRNLLAEIVSWGSPIYGLDHEKHLTLGFDLEWLNKPAQIFPNYWCSLQDWLCHSKVRKDKYKIMIMLTTLSYSQHAKEELVHTLLAFATISKFRDTETPQCAEYQLTDRYSPVREKVICLLKQHARQFLDCPESKLPRKYNESPYDAEVRQKRLYQSNLDQQIHLFAQNLLNQGLTIDLQTPRNPEYRIYISVEAAIKSLLPWYESWHRNAQFRAHIKKVQSILNGLPAANQYFQAYTIQPPRDRYESRRAHINFIDLQRESPPWLPAPHHRIFDQCVVQDTEQNTDRTKLVELLKHVGAQSYSNHQQRYFNDLLESFKALRESPPIPTFESQGLSHRLEEHLLQAQACVKSIYQMICNCLQAGLHDITVKAQMFPRLSPISILSHLASNEVDHLSNAWKSCFVQYGLSITTLQRVERLLASVGNEQELLNELRNPGHQDWDPMLKPDWLLFEVENNILIRQEQACTAQEMISPRANSNSLMQLNMGLGKSSVITPIVSVTLADKMQLVRVIVLKPLAMQMFQLLANKLGGMLNRRVLFMPISRSLNLRVHQALQIRHMYEDCMKTGSILLLQPEHILSFELMGPERLFSGNLELGNIMIDTQNWLYLNSRDVLDESDEILSVRFELVYTIGTQRAIEFSPDRWTVIQHVLGTLSRVATQVLRQFPSGLEVIPSKGFPRIRILQKSAGDELLLRVAQHLCDNGLPGLAVWNLSQSGRESLFTYLTDPQSSNSVTQAVEQSILGSETMKNGLLLLKGLFACGILNFAFEQKRWRVNYGLDPSRTPPTMLAVPYHAKDTPAPRAEFSHPDATIVLTSLSYYYGGLSNEQIRESFDALLQFDHAQEEYESWVKDALDLPAKFRHLTGINLSNNTQCVLEVFPPLSFSRGIINFYLSAIVFPSQMKEFPHKLSSSAWDIAREKEHPTTGFSGTNDSRYVLPLSITQHDLPEQLSTNAAVLECLLRPENSFANESEIDVLDAKALLDLASTISPPVRVILDVGSQVLELRNEEVAHEWLLRTPESQAQGVIFFDVHNEICVLNRDETVEPLLVSPFAKQMDQVLVYLDESHTRGTDLKMPANYRAMVTLGPNLTKDRVVQACMRLRKLGKGQSVVFCCPMEIQRKILEVSGEDRESIEVSDVLRWCISNTCASTKRSIPLWATQGVRHQNRRAAYSTALGAAKLTPELVESILEPEAQSLEQRYGNGEDTHEDQITRIATTQSLETRAKQLDQIRSKCQEFEVISFDAATLQEEQERELSPENEREVQVELPPALEPHKHHVHEHVRLLITNGKLSRGSKAFLSAFETLRNTTAAKYLDSKAWPNDLLVTADFATTVQAPVGQFLDFFLRPVHWIVTCKTGDTTEFVILSPYEAQELLPSIRQHKRVTLHVYHPRVTASMSTMEDLSFCAIPPVPNSWSPPPAIPLINLFAGQLYIQSYDDYLGLCDFLGLCSHRPGDDIEVACDGFINPANRSNSKSVGIRQCSFKTSPVDFVRMIMALRRKGQSISASHMGKILNGELIAEDQF